jgi:hypothetical protein
MRKLLLSTLSLVFCGAILVTSCKKKEDPAPAPAPEPVCLVGDVKKEGNLILRYFYNANNTQSSVQLYSEFTGDIQKTYKFDYASGKLARVGVLNQADKEVGYFTYAYQKDGGRLGQVNFYEIGIDGKDKLKLAQAYYYNKEGRMNAKIAGTLTATGEVVATEFWDYRLDANGNVLADIHSTLGASGSKEVYDSVIYKYDTNKNIWKGHITAYLFFGKQEAFPMIEYYQSPNAILSAKVYDVVGANERYDYSNVNTYSAEGYTTKTVRSEKDRFGSETPFTYLFTVTCK